MMVSRCSGEVAALYVVVAVALFARLHAITTPAVWCEISDRRLLWLFSTDVYAATSSFGSKLSARAICHIRE